MMHDCHMNKPTLPRTTLSFPDDMRKEINDYRFTNRIKTENEAIRLLLRAGLDAQATGGWDERG